MINWVKSSFLFVFGEGFTSNWDFVTHMETQTITGDVLQIYSAPMVNEQCSLERHIYCVTEHRFTMIRDTQTCYRAFGSGAATTSFALMT